MFSVLIVVLLALQGVLSISLPVKKAEQEFILLREELDWFSAWERCRANGMYLSSIENEQDNRNVQTVAEDNGYRASRFWTSGNELGNRNSFVWSATGGDVNTQLYKNWESEQPTDIEEGCVDMAINEKSETFKWSVQKCTDKKMSVCQKLDCPCLDSYRKDTPDLKQNGDLWVSTMKANWMTAVNFCRKNKMKLVSIVTENDNRKIQTAAEDADLRGEPFWTSGSDQGHEEGFTWFSDGAFLRDQLFSNWLDGEPNNENENQNCIRILLKENTFVWDDDKCDPQYYFMCEDIGC